MAMIGSIGCVLKAQEVKGKEKGPWMHRHKSLGVLSGIIMVPRLGMKLMSSEVASLAGSTAIEIQLAKASHYLLYAFGIVMPVTGISMGLWGGKGLPFFFTTIPSFVETNGFVAKWSFKIHKQVGTYGKFLVPVHVGAAGAHAARGHGIFSRINPFR